ncbi:MAG: translocation/assembly module TamB domain-containing protein, partial [Dysgonamonadaceae bacterium]|nr:translocation/assembly module TamB domain-containing protein [Dysgonamonadaceae bacterium]
DHCYETIAIQGNVSGNADEIRLNDLNIASGSDLTLGAELKIRNPVSGQPSQIYAEGYIHYAMITPYAIRCFGNALSNKPIQWPDFLQSLGVLWIDGEMNGYLDNLTAGVSCVSDIGDLQANFQFKQDEKYLLQGNVITSGIQLNKLLNNNDFGLAELHIDFAGSGSSKNDLQGTFIAGVEQFDYKSYPYHNIDLTGDYADNQLNMNLKTAQPDGQLTAQASIHLQDENSEYHFSAQASNLLLDRLHLTEKYRQPELSFAIDADIKGNRFDNLTGILRLKKLSFSDDEKTLNFKQLAIKTEQWDSIKTIRIDSDLLSGELSGVFAFADLPGAFKNSVAGYLPSLVGNQPQIQLQSSPHFRWNFMLNNTEQLSSVLNLPAVFYNRSQIEGQYDSRNNQIRMQARFPRMQAFGSTIEDSRLELNNGNGYLELLLNGAHVQKKSKLDMAVELRGVNDSIYAGLHWNNKGKEQGKYNGHLYFTSQVSIPSATDPMAAFFRFQSSKMVFNDSIWTMGPTSVRYQNNMINIEDFVATHNQQSIKIDGSISGNENDEVSVELNQVDLDYIFKSLNIKALTFGGVATGHVSAKDLYHTRQLSTQLDIRDFSYNYQNFGQMNLLGRWNDEKQNVEMKGQVVKNDSSFVDVDGYIDPMNETLSILFDAHHTDVLFLRPFLDHIIKDLSGQATGPIRLLGSLNDPTVEGKAWIDNGAFGIEFLNTRYSFSDWITFKTDEIKMENATMTDSYGHKAQFSGSVRHHLFDDFRFSANINFENFLVFNATHNSSPSFYGTIFGTGNAKISGTEKLVEIEVKAQNSEKTELALNFMKKQDIADYNFIRFKSKPIADLPEDTKKNPVPKTNPATEIRLNLMIEANRDATMNLIMDPLTEDKISVIGAGNINVQYGNLLPVKVFGNYRIEEGKYNFSFQQAFYRRFDIADGSSVTFRGDPLKAELNIKAAHTVSANLGDLDQQLVASEEGRWSARNNVPVSCVLLLSGALEQPQIKFDLEMPGATSELERQVKSYIRTDDMMNRQIIYLLLVGRFYTAPEYANINGRSSTDLSFLASTLSTSISNLLAELSDKIQVGANIHQFNEGDITKTEVELLLSGSLLNNRLIINGNLGYIDKPYLNASNSNVPLIGDFDLEYKLTKSGDIRLKGFNHYNYRNYYSLTPEMTQGFGILFRKDFNAWRDFIRLNNRTLTP